MEENIADPLSPDREDREGIQKLAVGTARCSRYKVNFWNAFCFYPEESEEFPDIPDF